MNQLWLNYKAKARDMRPFLKTKIGKRLAILGAIEFIALFFAPLLHGVVGTAIFGCVAAVYLILIWRRYDRDHAIVPALILYIPLLLDMLIYIGRDDIKYIISFSIIAMIAIFIAAKSPVIIFYDGVTDTVNTLLIAGALCVVVVGLALVTAVLVRIAWWILCIIAFFVVIAVFMGVVFSTAMYTASDGRRQARRDRERRERSQQEGSDAYQPRKRDTKIYTLDEDDFRDIDD